MQYYIRITIMLACAVLSSCAKEAGLTGEGGAESVPEEANKPAEAVEFRFRAALRDSSPSAEPRDVTRAEMSDSGVTTWDTGDAIAVWDNVSGEYKTFTNRGDGGAEVTFSFTGEEGVNYDFTRAVYPVTIATDYDGLALPSSYGLDDASSARTIPLVGTVRDNEIAFKHLAAMLRVTVEGIPSAASILTVSSPEVSLCGDFTLSGNGIDDGKTEASGEGMTEGDASPVTKAGGQGEGVEIRAAEGSEAVSIDISGRDAGEVKLYVPIPVGAYNYTLTLKDSGGESLWTKSTTSAKEIERAGFYLMKTVGATLSGGNGTEENPFRISSAEDFATFHTLCGSDASYRSKSYVLTGDIDLGGRTFSPIGTTNTDAFSGTFDGDGHTIRNFSVSSSAANCGLFGYLTGTVSNLNFEGAEICATGNYAGCVAGVLNGGRIERCSVDAGSVISSSARGAGCIVGFVCSGIINACAAHGFATAGTDCAGGIAGYLNTNDKSNDILVINCTYEPVYKDGHLYGATLQTSNATAHMAGIAGSAYAANNFGQIRIVNCYAYPLEMKSTQSASTAIKRVSGIVGYLAAAAPGEASVSVVNCFSPITYSNVLRSGTRVNASTYSDLTYVSAIVGQVNSTGAKVSRTFSSRAWGKTYGKASSATFTESNNVSNLDAANMRGLGTVTVGSVEYLKADGGMVAALNAGVAEWNAASPEVEALEWTYYPTFGYPKPQGVDSYSATVKKVSLLGDSISTYQGFMLADESYSMNKFYPVLGTAPQVSNEQLTWWWRLIYDKMSDTRLEFDNAYSGSSVTYTDVKIDGMASFDHRCNTNSIQKRALDYGVGSPDILFFYAGRNDFGVFGDKTDLLLGDYSEPSLETAYDSSRETLFNNYSQGAVAILRNFHNDHPAAKILMIMHDQMSDGYEDAANAVCTFMAGKGCDIRLVNLHVRGTTDATNTTIGLPKESGTHPNATGTENLANYVWNQVGSWLDE